MKKRTKLIAIAAGAAILVLGAGYTVFIAPKLEQEKWVYIEAAVERGPLTVGVTESGSLEYGITSILYDLNLTVSESDEDEEDSEEEETVQKYLKVEEIYVAAGQRVEAGDTLVKFTEDSVESVRKLLQSALVDAKATYNEAESEYELAVLEAQTEYESRMISQKYAQSIYADSNSSVDDEIAAMQIEIQMRTANISSLEEKVTDATENYNEAKEAYTAAVNLMDWVTTDHATSFISSQSSYLSAQTRFQNAENALTQARENLEENAIQIEALEYQLADAKARKAIDKLDVEETYREAVINGDNAQITYDAAIESLKEDLQEEAEELQKVEEQVEAFEAFVGEKGIIYADAAGIITEVGYESGDRLTSAGTVVAYAEPDNMTITVDVTQEDIISLAVGNTVEIQFSAYPDERYEGTIQSINTTATSRESNTISYQVVIGVKGDTEALYGGMTADITFVTEEKEDVLYVSRKAIVEENGKTYVYVQTALGGKELQEVETGIRNSTSVEIVSGLEEGDVIYIASKVSSEEDIEAQAQEEQPNEGEIGFDGSQMPDFGNGEMPDFGGGEMPDFGGGMPDMGNMSMPGMEGRP